MTYEDKTSYDSTPPCTTHVDYRADLCGCLMVTAWKQAEIRQICLLLSLLYTLTIYHTLEQFTTHVDNLPHTLNLELTFENIRGDRLGMGQKFAKSLPATQFTTYVDYRADFREFLSEFLLPAVRAHTGMRKFSKVCFIVIVYSKLSSKLTFDNFSLAFKMWAHTEMRKFSKVSTTVIVYSNLTVEETHYYICSGDSNYYRTFLKVSSTVIVYSNLTVGETHYYICSGDSNYYRTFLKVSSTVIVYSNLTVGETHYYICSCDSNYYRTFLKVSSTVIVYRNLTVGETHYYIWSNDSNYYRTFSKVSSKVIVHRNLSHKSRYSNVGALAL